LAVGSETLFAFLHFTVAKSL